MPARCTLLLHRLSLLLLVGLQQQQQHLLAGSSPLGSPSSSPSSSSSFASTDRSQQFAAAGPQGSAAPTQEGPSFTLLPREKGSPESSSAPSSVWDPATEGHSSPSKPVIMNSKKAVDSSVTETRTPSSQTHNTDAFRTFVNGEGRTDNISVSTASLVATTSYTEMIQSSSLAKDSSSVMQTRIVDASSRTMNTAELETVRSPKTPVSSFSEDYILATGSSHSISSSWDADRTTTGLHTESMDSSLTTVSRGEGKTAQFRTDSVTQTDPARTDLAAQTETTISDQTSFPSPATLSRGRSTTSNATEFAEPSARTVLTHSYLSPNIAVENSDLARSSSNTEKGIPSSHTDTSPSSGLPGRGEERTLRTLRDISSFHNATQMSITSNTVGDNNQETSSSVTEQGFSGSHTDSLPVSGPSDGGDRMLQTLTNLNSSYNAQLPTTSGSYISSTSGVTDSSYVLNLELTSETNLSLGNTDFTEAAFLHFKTPSETTDLRSSQHTFSNFNIEKRTTLPESTFSPATLVGSEEGKSLTNGSNSTDATQPSAFYLEDVSSSDLIHASSAIAPSVRNAILSAEMDFTESSNEPLLTYSSRISVYSPSTIDFASTGSSHQPAEVSDGERRVSSASTDSLYLSATFRHGGERTSRSLPDNSTSPNAGESISSNTEAAKSSDSTLSSVAETDEHNISLSEVQFTEPSTKRLPEYSSAVPVYSTSARESSTVGNYQNSFNSSSTETRVSHSYTATVHSSVQLSTGEEQTLQAIINSTLIEVTESTSLYMEKSKASEQNPSPSEVYSQRTDFSVQDFDISGPSTETFQSLRSSKIPTYSSFQSEHSDTGTDYQSMSSTDTGKRTSVSHTDSTHISTTFTRGGERTLLSIPNNSTSESSTFYAEISSPSESVQPSFSVTQSRGSNMSLSDGDFPGPSTEPLTIQSLKTPGYSSTVSEPHTTPFYSTSESTSASSLFSSSSPTSPQQDSLPPTQPTILFSSSESSPPSTPLPSTSQTTLMTFSPRLLPTPPPTLPPFSSLLPSLSSTSPLLQSNESFETSVSMAASEGTTGVDPSISGNSHSEYNSQTGTYPLKDSTGLRSTGSSPLLTETTEQFINYSSPVTISLRETKSSREQNFTLPGTNLEKTIPVLTTSPTYLSEGTTVAKTAKATTSMFPTTASQKDVFSLVEVTTGEKLTKMTHTTLGLTTWTSSTNNPVTTKPHKVHSPSSTKVSYSSGTPLKEMETSRTTSVKVTAYRIPTMDPPRMFSSSKTTIGPFPASPVPTKSTMTTSLGSPKTSAVSHGNANACTTDTCLNNGKCIIDRLTGKIQCQCSSGWQGEDCSSDIDECLSNPCPALATCTNTHGSFQCMCSFGYWMEKGQCNLVRTFVGQFPLTFNTTGGKYSELHQVEEALMNMLNNSLATLPGYYSSTVKASREAGNIQVSVQSTFSLVSNVTLFDVTSAVRSHIRACKVPKENCQFLSNFTQLHRVGGLCKHKDPECDKETSVCLDLDGIAVCQCKPGYFKYNKLDHSCRACEDGYKLENGTCVSCPFGLGGFNCGNPYQLITIVIAAAGGGLLLIMGIALIVTCCQKNKNDISKLIFKSGDFQMSPYAEYPKTPRAQDWGRETIEMQENGSTKNLLQMTDVYYMPANLRNPELERNGVYPPYTGLPGSRHSCIYPGQYNPSFISDDSRRRDYF
ncbi:protein HEG homolog 1 isoform X3 [Hemicordylus capensis]|uniref:protein HEG homolog 1 isoform X3 n=1 Tax=Hemicordylus capensis TaxID=884348 RepID=UPI00230385F6|nr:protein HEG homolog 1 isoform X3 [Hemicordylus capensis]